MTDVLHTAKINTDKVNVRSAAKLHKGESVMLINSPFTKMARFMLEGPRQCTVFCFVFMNYIKRTFLLVSSPVSSNRTVVFSAR